MTKTIKKRLMLCLILLMVMFIGASFSAINVTHAAENDNITSFIAQIDKMIEPLGYTIKDGTITGETTKLVTKEKIFPDTATTDNETI